MNIKTDNPFFYNYLWSDKDLDRMKIKMWQYPLLWFLPTYVTVSCGIAWHYKRFNGKIFLMKSEDLMLAEKERIENEKG